MHARLRRAGHDAYRRLTALNYAHGWPTRKRTVAGAYRSFEPWNVHGRDAGLAALTRLTDPGDVVVDAGAHVGEYTLPLAAARRTVHAVEPDPVSVARLRANAAASGMDPTVHECGLGDEDGERPFYRSTLPKSSGFSRGAAERWGGSVAATLTTRVARLDTLVADGIVPPPAALKLDVEGAERAVLAGAHRTLREHAPVVVVEPHGEERALRGTLAGRGYRVTAHDDCLVCTPP